MKNTTTRQPAISAIVIDGVLHVKFSHGPSFTINPRLLSPHIVEAATLHGLKQKLIDAAAISRDLATGRAATLDTKYEAVKEVHDRITAPNGTWNKIREGGGNVGGLLLQALGRLYPSRTKEDLVEFLAGKTEAQKTALRGNSRVAAIIEEIKAERGDSANSDELLSELEG